MMQGNNSGFLSEAVRQVFSEHMKGIAGTAAGVNLIIDLLTKPRYIIRTITEA